LNNSLIDYTGSILFTSQDHEFIQTVADRIVEITPKGFVNVMEKYEDFISKPEIQKRRAAIH